MPPEKGLFILAREALKEYSGQNPGNWQTILLTQECRNPGPVFDEVVDAYFRPETDFIAQMIGRAVNKSEDNHQVRFAVLTMIGLLETFGLYGHLITAVAPGMISHFKDKDGLARQIVHLVLEAADPLAQV